MNRVLHDSIKIEALKLVRRHQQYASNVAESLLRKERRSGISSTKVLLNPQYWAAHPGFDPYKVRSQSAGVAHAIDKALKSGSYNPRPAVKYGVPKGDGSERVVSVFQVADNAISRLTFERLMVKNARHLSPNAYAYRNDLTIHDAILHITSDFQKKPRLFVAEFDFAKFFDSISHEHLDRVLHDQRFFITSRERIVIDAFLRAPALALPDYSIHTLETRERGIPQGTSISLFLANIAAFPLDRKLEKLGVGFARYADDTLIWADDYSSVCAAVNAIEEIGLEMGVELNLGKSAGISILCPADLAAEMQFKPKVSFIGYSISPFVISIRPENLERIKKHLSYLIYSNLLQAPKQGHLLPNRLSGLVDKDYLVMLVQIRRFLYGELTESKLRKYLGRQTPLMRYHGVMSFYPIVTDENLLRELDGWLLNSVMRALKLRRKLFAHAGFTSTLLPHNSQKTDLLKLKIVTAGGKKLDLRFPSIARVGRLMRRAARVYGANVIANPQSKHYYAP